MKFSWRANCSTRRSIAFCSSAIFYLNLSTFSFRTRMVSSCFLCCLNKRASFCSSITILSRMEVLLTKSRPCSQALRFKSLFSFRVPFIFARKASAQRLSSSSRLGLAARNLILSSRRALSLPQLASLVSLVFFSSSSRTSVPSRSLVCVLSVLPRLANAFFSIWQSTSSLSSFKHARSFSYSFQI